MRKNETPNLEALKVLIRIAEDRGIRILLIGAYARQLVFDVRDHGNPYRATRDIDAAVRVASWDEYNSFRTALIDEAGFVRVNEHRIRFLDGIPR